MNMKKFVFIFSLLISALCKAQDVRTPYYSVFGYRPNYELPQSFTYTLDSNYTLSEGIYNSQGALVRTLVSVQPYAAGSHIEVWDGLDDNGNQLPVDNYTYKIKYNNISATWDSTWGNTSLYNTGYNVWKGGVPPTALCIVGNNGYLGHAYNEQNTCTSKFALNNIQVRQMLDFSYQGATPEILDNGSDGNKIYWAAYDAGSPTKYFIYSTNVNTDTLVTFSAGSSYSFTYGHTYSVFGLTSTSVEAINSIAIQGSTGTYIYAARPSANRIDCYNKSTGASVGSTTITNPSNIRLDTVNNILWVAHATTVDKYTVNSDGSLTFISTPITGLLSIQALGINPLNGNIYVADGSTSQQIKAFNTSGTQQSTWGTAGGYLNNALCSYNKWYWNSAFESFKVFLAFQSDGTCWVNDGGNCQVIHYNTSQAFLEKIQWIPYCYSGSVDYNNINTEYAMAQQYSASTDSVFTGGKGWSQIANWRGQLNGTQYSKYQGLRTPLTFGNGKTFCFVYSTTTANWELIELQSTGVIRFTGQTYPSTYFIDKSGDLYSMTSGVNGQAVTWVKRNFTGYDGNGTPQWGSDVTMSHTPVLTNASVEPVYRGNNTLYNPLTFLPDSSFISWDADKNNSTGYHLGRAKGGNWLGKSALSTYPAYTGFFPDPSRFDVGNSVQNAGGIINVQDSFVFAHYYGEFWKSSETNMFGIFDGYSLLPLYQFGVANGLTAIARQANYAGDAGNDFSIRIVKKTSNLWFAYQNEEGIHAAGHRWRITGMNYVKGQSGAVVNAGVNYTNAVNTTNLLQGLPNTKGNFITANAAKWTFSDLPFYTNNPSFGYTWNASTGTYIYDKSSSDLYFYFVNQTSINHTATCNLLPVIPTGMTSWILDMTMSAPASNNNFYNGSSSNKYVDLLDTAGKIIARFQHTVTTYPTVAFLVNSATLATTTNQITAGTNGSLNQPWRLIITGNATGTSSQISSIYGNSANTSSGVFQTGANPLAPASLKITFIQNGGTAYAVTLDIQKANFYPSTL